MVRERSGPNILGNDNDNPALDSATRAPQATHGILCRLGMFALPKTVRSCNGRSRSNTERPTNKRPCADAITQIKTDLADLRAQSRGRLNSMGNKC